MKNIAVINGTALKHYAFNSVSGGSNAFDAVLAYARTIPEVGSIVVLSDGNPRIVSESDSVPFRVVQIQPPFTVEALLYALTECSLSFDNLFYFYADTPFLDESITRRMYDIHMKYRSEYSFADGYPYGLTPEIIRTGILPALKTLASGNTEQVYRDTIFTVIQKDINAFDIETEISPVDQRLLRVSLSCDSWANFTLVERLAMEKAQNADDIVRMLQEKPQLLRTFPAFVNIQITGGCPQACSYCPYPEMNPEILSDSSIMPVADFSRILDKIEVFSKESVISISLWGEPSLHPDIPSIVLEVMKREGLSLVIETSGIGWKREHLETIRSFDRQPLAWIVSLDARDPVLYGELRGAGYDEAAAAADLFNELFPGRTWIQGVRMNENEEHLETFYKYYRDSGRQVIIQKYDHFCRTLPDRKVSDLSPVNRFPCWHIKRDLAVLLDGSVPLCREDTHRAHVLGNIFVEPVAEIWERAERFHIDHIVGNYPEICRGCDEYYTYNF